MTMDDVILLLILDFLIRESTLYIIWAEMCSNSCLWQERRVALTWWSKLMARLFQPPESHQRFVGLCLEWWWNTNLYYGEKTLGHHGRILWFKTEFFIFFCCSLWCCNQITHTIQTVTSDGCQPKSVSKGFVSSTEVKNTSKKNAGVPFCQICEEWSGNLYTIVKVDG